MGFFVELVPERFQKPKGVTVFSGDETFSDSSNVIERRGKWFAPYLATLITSAGRLLLAMLEIEVRRAGGTYLYCDTDSLAILSSEHGGPLSIPGAKGERILAWKEVDTITAKFQALNPYDPDTVKDLLNLTDDNYVCECSHELKEHGDSGACEIPGCCCKTKIKVRRQLWGLGIASKRYTLLEKIFGRKGRLVDIKIINPKAHGIGYLYQPKDNPKDWKKEAPLWVYEMWDFIVRGFVGLKRTLPAWASLPQMMRFSLSTWNVLKMLRMWPAVRTRGASKYVASQNYVWQVSEAQYAKIVDEITTKGRIGSLNDYGKYLGRIDAQPLEVRTIAVDLGSRASCGCGDE